jgi:uncharacterized Zn-binding protein involved in type VI secretion
MPGPVIQVGAALQCPHLGTITIVPGGAQVTVDGMPVANLAVTGTVIGCTNVPTPVNPTFLQCTTVTWTTGAARVTINGVPALVVTSLAVFNCVPPIAGVPATVISTQEHVTAQ